jgi:hypothetical protein
MDRSSLTIRTTWQIKSGRMFHLPLLLPAGWEVEHLDMSPPELLRDWHLEASPAGTVLVADLTESVGNRAVPRLLVRLRPRDGAS